MIKFFVLDRNLPCCYSFRMLQGAFIIYALGMASGVAAFLLEIYVIHKEIKKESIIRKITNDHMGKNQDIVDEMPMVS